jgi:hypothetical protein
MAFKIDFHVHVDENVDFKLLPKMLLWRGLDGAGLVTHNDLGFAQKIVKFLTKEKESKIYFAGVEIDTSDGHLLAFGIKDEITQNMSPQRTIELIHRQGGIAIIPHPFMIHNSLRRKAEGLPVEGIEILNGFAKIVLDIPNIISIAKFAKTNKSLIGGSDAHHAQAVGSCYTEIFLPEKEKPNEETILQAVRDGRILAKKRAIDNHDVVNLLKILFTPKKGRRVVRIL